jgi:hypothetical protein
MKRWSPVPVLSGHFERAAIGEYHAVGEALRRATLHDICSNPRTTSAISGASTARAAGIRVARTGSRG